MYEKELAAYFEAHKDEFLEDLAVLVAIPSVKTEPSGDCPYGRNTAKALSQSLSIAEKYDLYTENWENYVGIVQIEPGRRMLDILAHLDVVAPGDGWEVTKPYTMKISEGKEVLPMTKVLRWLHFTRCGRSRICRSHCETAFAWCLERMKSPEAATFFTISVKPDLLP